MPDSKNHPGVWVSMSPGLRARMLAQVDREGISASAILRRSLMHELSVDANGEPIERSGRRGV